MGPREMTNRYGCHSRTEFTEGRPQSPGRVRHADGGTQRSRAAQRNGVSQPAVSKALNRLRYLFDDPLFVRRDRGMEPTARALELAGPIHGALTDISRTLTLPAAFEPSIAKATVQIATIDLPHQALSSHAQYLRRHAPGVDLQVRANDCSQLRDQLATGEIDIALRR